MDSNIDRPFRVLLAEDDSVMAEIIEGMLKQMSIRQITRARNGAEALSLFYRDNYKYSLIISDWSMPEMSGLELLKAVRASDSHIPILMITARKESAAVRQAANAQVTSYIAKPFSALELQKKMESILQTAIEEQVRLNNAKILK